MGTIFNIPAGYLNSNIGLLVETVIMSILKRGRSWRGRSWREVVKLSKFSFDAETKKWFRRNPFVETTVVHCPACGLAYKPSLGHNCKQNVDRGINDGTTD